MKFGKMMAVTAMGLALATTGIAQAANLVTNGGFESTTHGANQFISQASGGFGGYATTDVTGWNYGHGGVAAVYNNASDAGAVGAPFAGFQHYLWSTNNPTGPLGTYPVGPVTVVDSNNGGHFIAADADGAASQILSQSIGGLTVGQTYALSFEYAGAQFRNATGTQWNGGFNVGWKVQFGSDTVYTGNSTTGNLSVSSHGFTGWQDARFVFKATSATETLKFFAISNLASGLPPVALLDGVDIHSVPEPSSFALTAMALVGFGALRLRRKSAV